VTEEKVGDEHGLFPRPLTERELATLRFMLSVPDGRLDPLRSQVPFTTVVGRCPCPCASIELSVDRSQATAAQGLGERPAVSTVGQEPGNELNTYFLMVWLDKGWLSSLEVAYIEHLPTEFPPLELFEPPKIDEPSTEESIRTRVWSTLRSRLRR